MNERRPAPAASKRRRRRQQQIPVEEIAAEAPPSTLQTSARRRSRPPRWQRWILEAVSSLGPSPTFHAYLFAGSILAILGFFFYNDSIIRDFREQERGRAKLYADLHAFAASPWATPEQIEFIFQKVIRNPRADFPMIFTDHRGEISQWKGEGLPDPGDTSAAAMQSLRAHLESMGARNAPIPLQFSAKSFAYLHQIGGGVVITDTAGEIVAWSGSQWPPPGDTTAAARQVVAADLYQPDRQLSPLAFSVQTDLPNYLHRIGGGAVITDTAGEIVAWSGSRWPPAGDATAAAREIVAADLYQPGRQLHPLAFKVPSATRSYIYYGDSDLISRVSLAPFIQMGVLTLFLVVGYIGFRNIKRSEQRSIWVGMAKETAHQLGTPLSSLSGWLELVAQEISASGEKDLKKSLAQIDHMADEMGKDMRRLNQIASRFGQVGSVPELKTGDLHTVLAETVAYFQGRGPQFGRHDIRVECNRPIPGIPLNAELMGWAFENLFKNSIDAFGPRPGAIEIDLDLTADGEAVEIRFADNGRGIEPEHVKRVFDPGFSTKKRGWGLGLAFVKRIVEEYHKGRISVIRSVPGEGTTIAMTLPIN